MPRAKRIVVPDVPHHVVQRGNRRQPIFFADSDRRAYVALLRDACARHGTRCLGWCLMDNHVHLILVPRDEDGLRAPLASTHTAFAQRLNRREGLVGHLFQGRFASYAMDEAHLMVAVRYVENNPVAAGLVRRAEEWRWSSARAHLGLGEDGLTDAVALGKHVRNWRAMLARGLEAADEEAVERSLRTGRPLASAAWLAALVRRGHLTPSRPRGRPRAGQPAPLLIGPTENGDCPPFRKWGLSPFMTPRGGA